MPKPFRFQDFAAISGPCRVEGDIGDLIIEGEIPKEINGTFYRVAQDPYYDPDYFQDGAKQTPFDGDGNVSAFKISNGVVSWKQRYVQTERLVAEKKAGRSLFGLLHAPFTHHPCVQSLIASGAHTNVILHNKKLLALQEAGPPYEMDPNTLETIGHEPFKGELDARRPYTAHPKVDPDTGDLIGYGYSIGGPMDKKMNIIALDKDGKKLWERDTEAPTTGPFHDMVLTPNYVVVVQMPFIVDNSDVYSPGRHAIFYDQKSPSYFGVVPRNDMSKPVRWFKWKNCMNIHTGCAWEKDNMIFFDCTRAHDNVFTFLPYWDEDLDKRPTNLVVDYVKWKIDLSSESDTVEDPEILFSVPCEFPRTDERFLGKSATTTFLAIFKTPEPGKAVHQGLNALARYMSDTKKLEVLDPGNCLVQEPTFIPRTQDAPEGDGWLIVMIDNLDAHRNDLLIIDTRDFTKVLATIQLPLRLRSAVHGNWVDAERIPETAST